MFVPTLRFLLTRVPLRLLYPELGNFAEQYNKMAFRNLDSETLDYLNTLLENLKIN